MTYATGHGSLRNAPAINHESLSAKGFTAEKLTELEAALASAFDIKFVFNKWTLGAEFLHDVLKIPAEKLEDQNFDLLSFLGFSRAEIDAANIYRLRRHDARRRAAFEAGALRRVRLRQPLRAHRQTLSLPSKATSA